MEFKLLKIINKSRIKLLKKNQKNKKYKAFQKMKNKNRIKSLEKIRKIENKFFPFNRKNGVVMTRIKYYKK